MTITSYHIQNIIRAYGQRLGRRGGLRRSITGAAVHRPDTVTISEEGKKRQIADTLAKELRERLGQGDEEQALDPALVERISQEMGGSIEAGPLEREKGSFRFKVLDPERGEVVKEFSAKSIGELFRNLLNSET